MARLRSRVHIGEDHRGGRTRVELPIRLALAALVPLAIAGPLQLIRSSEDPLTIVLLGPAFEESLKLSILMLALAFAAVALRGGRDPALALRYWLFSAPWIVGGLFGLLEGLAFYPGQGGPDFTLREFAHATFVALALAAALGVWRQLDAPFVGIGYGFATGLAAHIGFNLLALFSVSLSVTFADQLAYLVLIFVIALLSLRREVRVRPPSRVARAFLPSPGRRVHP